MEIDSLPERCQAALAIIYRVYRSQALGESKLIEVALGPFEASRPPSVDDRRNEKAAYDILFTSGHADCVVTLFRRAVGQLRSSSFVDSADAIAALCFIQQLVATARFRFDHSIDSELADFARDYERIDSESEQRRLHAAVNGGSATDRSQDNPGGRA